MTVHQDTYDKPLYRRRALALAQWGGPTSEIENLANQLRKRRTLRAMLDALYFKVPGDDFRVYFADPVLRDFHFDYNSKTAKEVEDQLVDMVTNIHGYKIKEAIPDANDTPDL